MKKIYSTIVLLLLLVGCNGNNGKLRQVKPNVAESKNYILEDIATDIEVIELQDTTLIGGVQIIKAYSDLLFIFDIQQNQILIYKDSGEFVASLNKIGKGPNEYIDIGTFSFDENSNILSIHARATTEIIRYKVPTMEFIDRFDSNGYFNAMENIGNNSLFCTKEGDFESAGSMDIMNIEKKISSKLQIEPKYISQELTPDNVITRLNSDELLFCYVSGSNTVYQVNKNQIATPLFDINFESYSIPDKYWEAKAEDNIDLGDALAEGSYAIMPQFIREDAAATSFWYIVSAAQVASSQPGMQFYHQNKINGDTINASSLYLKDTEIAIQAIGLSDGYYLALIDRDEIPSDTKNETLKDVKSTSKNNTPILLKFKIN